MSQIPTAFISLEMKDTHMGNRFFKNLTVSGDEEQDYTFPCFDCCYNQDNTCNKKIRTNNSPCPTTFDPLNLTSYKPCTACRGIYLEEKDFLPTTWFFSTNRPKLSLSNIRKTLKTFNKHFGSNLFRMIAFPAFSATMKDINSALDDLFYEEGFTPKLIVTDYAGIIASTKSYNDPRHELLNVWEGHKQMAQDRNAFVVTGTQSLGSSRSALIKDMQDETDIAQNAYILAHVDILSVLDQTPEEKEKGIWRIGIIEHRHKKFNKRRQVMALQQLELGQPILDTELVYWNSRGGN
jgi:hypothetical protein